MISLVYTSSAIRPFSALELFELLRRAREHNRAASITGLLVYAQQGFLQMLEGDSEPVEQLYAAIERDPRHFELRVVSREAITIREYPHWSMGFAFPDPEKLAAVLPGYDPHGCLARDTIVSRDTARLLLAALAADIEDGSASPIG